MAAIKKLKNSVTPLASNAGESEFNCTVDLNFATNGIVRQNYNAQAAVGQGKPKESRY